MHQIRAQLMKKARRSAEPSSLAACKAQLRPPASAIFSETTNLPLTLPAGVVSPSNCLIIFSASSWKCLRSASVHQLFIFPYSSNFAPLLSKAWEISWAITAPWCLENSSGKDDDVERWVVVGINHVCWHSPPGPIDRFG